MHALCRRIPQLTACCFCLAVARAQEFKNIYAWLGCRFDHDFFESEVSEESMRMVEEYYKKGVLVSR